MQELFWEISKNGHSIISSKIWQSVSEVLNALVGLFIIKLSVFVHYSSLSKTTHITHHDITVHYSLLCYTLNYSSLCSTALPLSQYSTSLLHLLCLFM